MPSERIITYVATMDTEHFQFVAVGGTEASAKASMADGFARHLGADLLDEFLAGAAASDDEPLADVLAEYYGIRVHDFTDAETVTRDGAPIR